MRALMYAMLTMVAVTFVARGAPLSEAELKKSSRGGPAEPDDPGRFSGRKSDQADEKAGRELRVRAGSSRRTSSDAK